MMLNATQEKIRDLLAAGVSQTQVAHAIGVDDSYVSQLMADEEFRTQVQDQRAKTAGAAVAADQEVESIEAIAREKIRKLLLVETNLMKVLQVYKTMNGADRKFASASASGMPAGTTVNIQLPQQAAIQFKLSSTKEVIEIEGRALATLPSHQVEKRLRELRAVQLVQDVTPLVDQALVQKLAQF